MLFTSFFTQADDEKLPHFVHFEVLQEKDDSVDFAAILMRQDWKTVTSEFFTGGYSRDVYWVKLSLVAPVQSSLLFTVLWAALDDVRLYIPDNLVDSEARISPNVSQVTGWRYWQQGDCFPFRQRELNWRGFSFALHVPDTKEYTVYLRVKSTSTNLIFPQLWTPAQFVEHQKTEMLVLGLVMGIMGLFSVIAGLYFFLMPELLQKSYFQLMLCSTLFMYIVNGFIAQWLPDSPELASNAVGIIAGLHYSATCNFHLEFLFGHIRKSFIYRLQNAMRLFGLLTASFAAIGQYQLIAGIFHLLAAIVIAVNFVAIIWMKMKNTLPDNIFVIYVVISLVSLFSLFGLLGGGGISPLLVIHGVQISLLIVLAILLAVIVNVTNSKLNTHIRTVALAELQAKASESQRYWLAMLTHEIKTPLSVINASCQSIELLGSEAMVLSRIDKIKRSTARIDNLVQGFLRNDEILARLQHLQQTVLKVKNWLPEQLQFFDEVAQKRLQLKIEPELEVFTDASLLSVALNNLLTNAIKYSDPNSVIEIQAQTNIRQEKAGILFQVKDYGFPIDEAKREHLFNRYEFSGSGVGLWACREIARAHDGEVWLDNTQTDGNTFNIWLPKKEDLF